MQIMTFGRRSLVLGLFMASAVVVAQQPPSDQAVVSFSDPSRPGTVKVDLVEGSVTVHGENRKDISINASGRETSRPRQRADTGGLRRLTPAPGFEVTEDHNEVVVESSRPNRALDFDIRVPARVNLRVGTVNGREILVDGVDGE